MNLRWTLGFTSVRSPTMSQLRFMEGYVRSPAALASPCCQTRRWAATACGSTVSQASVLLVAKPNIPPALTAFTVPLAAPCRMKRSEVVELPAIQAITVRLVGVGGGGSAVLARVAEWAAASSARGSRATADPPRFRQGLISPFSSLALHNWVLYFYPPAGPAAATGCAHTSVKAPIDEHEPRADRSSIADKSASGASLGVPC